MLSGDGGRLSLHGDLRSRERWPREYVREVDDVILREGLRTLTGLGGMMCGIEMKNGMIGDKLKKCGIDLNELNRCVCDDFLSNDLLEIAAMRCYARTDPERINPVSVMISPVFCNHCLDCLGLPLSDNVPFLR